jgi:hypothetical protein
MQYGTPIQYICEFPISIMLISTNWECKGCIPLSTQGQGVPAHELQPWRTMYRRMPFPVHFNKSVLFFVLFVLTKSSTPCGKKYFPIEAHVPVNVCGC